LCKETADIVEVGKCKDCKMEVLDVNDKANSESVKRYGIISVPSIVIDGRIKVVGKPAFPWFCGDDFYTMLEAKYPFNSRSAESMTELSPSGRALGVLCSCGGGIGAAVCTTTMLLPILVGTAGIAGASVVACSMPSMCGPQLTGILGAYVNFMTPIAQPLFAASMALILYGLKNFGKWPLLISGLGGAMLYVSMFVLAAPSLGLIVGSAAILAFGHAMAYLSKPLRRLRVPH
jgi:hypothetical protein